MQDLIDYWWLPNIDNPNMHAPAVLCEILKKSGVQNCLEFASMGEVVGEIIRQDLDEAFFCGVWFVLYCFGIPRCFGFQGEGVVW